MKSRTHSLRKILGTIAVLLIFSSAGASEISFTFENAAYTSDSGALRFEFDIYAAAEGFGLGPTLILIDYNPAAFGTSVASGGGVTAIPGSLISGNASYSLIVNDNTDSRLAITVYYDVLDPGGGTELTSSPQQLLHIVLAVKNSGETAGLSFAQSLMQGQQFQDDLVSVFSSTVANDNEIGSPDADTDGITDADDACPGTVIPESVPTVALRPNHFALTDGDGLFDSAAPGKGKGRNRSYTVADTKGCSCSQIIEGLGVGNGHRQYGCSAGVMDEWIADTAGKSGPLEAPRPDHLLLEGNYPNPFNPQTTIRFALPDPGRVRLTVYDLLGREVRLLLDDQLEAGHHQIRFDGNGLPSGTYLYRLEAQEKRLQRTLTLLR